MDKTQLKAITAQAKWIMSLAERIEYAAQHMDESETRPSGTINNLCPELSKAASKLRAMMRYNYFY